jgi:hypothetical protein
MKQSMITPGKDDHGRFIKHLNESSKAVFKVAYYLHQKGLDVNIPAIRRCKSHSEWKEYKDDGDLFISKGGKDYRIEVKARSSDFTDGTDWRYDDFFVCASHSYDMAEKKPYAYFILNKNRTHVAIINSDTHSSWNVVKKKDRRYENMVQSFYTCPLGLIKWEKI